MWPAQLTRYVAERLQCEPEMLTRAGVHLAVARQPRLRVWQYATPLWAMAFGGTAIVSVAPPLAAAARPILGRATPASLLEEPTVRQLRALAGRWGPTDGLFRDFWLYCTSDMFTPRVVAEVVPVPPAHPEGQALRELHRGAVFGVFRGEELISRSSIKTESDQAWEMAVTTTELHRRRGLGASVVSRATEFTLGQGKLAVYNCDIANVASRRLAESLGYRLFARDLMWSLEATWAARFWGDGA